VPGILAQCDWSPIDDGFSTALTHSFEDRSRVSVEEIAVVAILCLLIPFKGEAMVNSRESQRKAEAQFHKTIKKAQEAKQAMSQYEADARAVDAKTAKLRALRLAKEAAEAKAEENTQIKKRRSSGK
jgi:hypothetical protein